MSGESSTSNTTRCSPVARSSTSRWLVQHDPSLYRSNRIMASDPPSGDHTGSENWRHGSRSHAATFVGDDPSALATHTVAAGVPGLVPNASNATRLPSGDQSGRCISALSTTRSDSSGCSSEPSGRARKTLPIPVSSGRAYASHSSPSATVGVPSCRDAVRTTLTRQLPPLRRPRPAVAGPSADGLPTRRGTWSPAAPAPDWRRRAMQACRASRSPR